jgi:tetratricopeptide (TPR) repeat protein
MENLTFFALVFFAAVTLYRLLSRRTTTPKARVAAMLRRCRALEKTGLAEQECLFQLLATRSDWKHLNDRFLAELVSRLQSKEDLMRFVSVSEDYGYHGDHYTRIGGNIDLDAAMAEVAGLFARLGFRLQEQGRYREAEFVQKLALRLQPNQYFTNLPLAATYHETGRHADALPLFERGLAEFNKIERGGEAANCQFSPAKCLGWDAEIRTIRNRYRKMYENCLKTTKTDPGQVSAS